MKNQMTDDNISVGSRRSLWPLAPALLIAGALLLGLNQRPMKAQGGGTVPPSTVFLPIVTQFEASTRVYDAIPVDRDAGWPCQPSERPAAENADINLTMRDYAESDAALTLVDINGPTDPNAPQLPGIFADRRLPTFTAAYQVYDWDWACGENGCRGELLATWEATLLEMMATSGEDLTIPTRGPEIYGGGYKALVLYATPSRLTLAYTRHDTAACGYLVHLEDIAVDSALVALYHELNAAGRTHLPALHNDEPLGRVMGASVKVAVRDTGQFMDPRARKDWWQGY